MTFSDLVEAIKCFSTKENLHIQLFLQEYLREERQEEISQNLQAAKQEKKNGEL